MLAMEGLLQAECHCGGGSWLYCTLRALLPVCLALVLESGHTVSVGKGPSGPMNSKLVCSCVSTALAWPPSATVFREVCQAVDMASCAALEINCYF